jgi:hypothetical protein
MKKMLTPMLAAAIISSPLYGRGFDQYSRDRHSECSSFEKVCVGVAATTVLAGLAYGLYCLFNETADQAYSRCKKFLYTMHEYSAVAHGTHRELMYKLYSFSNRRYPVLTYKENLDHHLRKAKENLQTIRSWISQLKKEYRELETRYYFLIQDLENLERDYIALLPDLEHLSGEIARLPQYADERKERRKDQRQEEKLTWQKHTHHWHHGLPQLHVHGY